MKCNVCGYESLTNAKYCPKCGAPVLPRQRKFLVEVFWCVVVVALIVWLTFR
jgi:uncharacterized OB-fold protein